MFNPTVVNRFHYEPLRGSRVAMTGVLTEFVKAHPCEVWRKSEFHSRYATMKCAARTAAHIQGEVVDSRDGERWGTWKCNQEINKMGGREY